jgi:S-methylmethionine-dependent homocysteine/selenocysteine methylase
MHNMPNASLLRRITIFDGGMGTTLESSGHDISSALWSADPKLADAVKEVHEGFMAVGAGLIGSAT